MSQQWGRVHAFYGVRLYAHTFFDWSDFMWWETYNTSRLWTICKELDFCGGSPTYFEEKDKEQVLIRFAEGYFVYAQYDKEEYTFYIKSGALGYITRWEDGLDVRTVKHGHGGIKKLLQKHIHKWGNREIRR